MKITKELLKQIIKEEVGPVRGTSHGNLLQHLYVGGGQLKNYPTGQPPDNSTRDQAFTRPPYETLGIKVEFEGGDVFVTSGKTRYRVWFPEPDDRTRVKVVPCDEYAATIDGDRIDWDENTPASVKFDPHLEKFIKELKMVDYETKFSGDEPEQEEVEDED